MVAKLAICVAITLMAGAEEDAPKSDGIELLEVEQEIITFTNTERARYGLPPLEVDSELVESARRHATWMTRNRSLQHARQPGGENIAMGQRNSKDVMRAWMNSSGHRANILNRGYRRIGAAASRTESGTIYWCQQFRRGASPTAENASAEEADPDDQPSAKAVPVEVAYRTTTSTSRGSTAGRRRFGGTRLRGRFRS